MHRLFSRGNIDPRRGHPFPREHKMNRNTALQIVAAVAVVCVVLGVLYVRWNPSPPPPAALPAEARSHDPAAPATPTPAAAGHPTTQDSVASVTPSGTP